MFRNSSGQAYLDDILHRQWGMDDKKILFSAGMKLNNILKQLSVWGKTKWKYKFKRSWQWKNKCIVLFHIVTQLLMSVTKKYITQLNIHLDSSGTTCHTQPQQCCLLLGMSHGSLRVLTCPAFCLRKSKIISEAPEIYCLHLIVYELNRQNSSAKHSPQSLGRCQIFILWLPSLHHSAQW